MKLTALFTLLGAYASANDVAKHGNVSLIPTMEGIVLLKVSSGSDPVSIHPVQRTGLKGALHNWIRDPLRRFFNKGSTAKLQNAEKMLKNIQKRSKVDRVFCRRLDQFNVLIHRVDRGAPFAGNPECLYHGAISSSNAVIVDALGSHFSRQHIDRVFRAARYPMFRGDRSSMQGYNSYYGKPKKNILQKAGNSIKKMAKKVTKGVKRVFKPNDKHGHYRSSSCYPTTSMHHQQQYPDDINYHGGHIPPVPHTLKMKDKYRMQPQQIHPSMSHGAYQHHSVTTSCQPPVYHESPAAKIKDKHHGMHGCRRIHRHSQLHPRLMGVLHRHQNRRCTPQMIQNSRGCHYAKVKHSYKWKHGAHGHSRRVLPQGFGPLRVNWYEDGSHPDGYCVDMDPRYGQQHHYQAPIVV